jgi:hypothetical protein
MLDEILLLAFTMLMIALWLEINHDDYHKIVSSWIQIFKTQIKPSKTREALHLALMLLFYEAVIILHNWNCRGTFVTCLC